MYTDDHIVLRETVAPFLAAKSGSSALRKRTSLVDDVGEMGWAGLLLNENYGGSAMDITSACVLAQEIGRHLTLTPLLSSTFIPSFVIQQLASTQQKEAWLPAIADGCSFVANNMAQQLSNDLQLSVHEGNFKLTGHCTFVPDLNIASSLLLLASSSNGMTLCSVPIDAKGVSLEEYVTLDKRSFGKINLDAVTVESQHILPSADITKTQALGALLFASEQYGCAASAFDMTMDYLRQRKQFGRTLGSFQALQHRASALYADLAMAESIILKASIALENNAPEATKLCSIAKSKTGSTAMLMGNEAIQLHGGIGMTEEHDIGLHLKRIAVSEKLYGDTDYHTNRVAELSGF